jgi:hypothetical protein
LRSSSSLPRATHSHQGAPASENLFDSCSLCDFRPSLPPALSLPSSRPSTRRVDTSPSAHPSTGLLLPSAALSSTIESSSPQPPSPSGYLSPTWLVPPDWPLPPISTTAASSTRPRRMSRRSSVSSSADSETSSSSSLDSWDSEAAEREAQLQWEESLRQLNALANLVVVPYVSRYFGRKWAYWRALLFPFFLFLAAVMRRRSVLTGERNVQCSNGILTWG